MLVGLVAVFLFQQLAEDAEGDGGLERGAGLGDDVDVIIVVAELGENVAQIVRAQTVADKEHARISRGGDGAQQLDRAARAEVRPADADDDERLGAAADLICRGEDAVKLGIADLAGQIDPADKIVAETGALLERLVRESGKRVIGAGGGEKGGSAGKIDFDHGKSLLLHSFVWKMP